MAANQIKHEIGRLNHTQTSLDQIAWTCSENVHCIVHRFALLQLKTFRSMSNIRPGPFSWAQTNTHDTQGWSPLYENRLTTWTILHMYSVCFKLQCSIITWITNHPIAVSFNIRLIHNSPSALPHYFTSWLDVDVIISTRLFLLFN